MSGLRQRKKERTRESILAAAESIFLQKGYAAATVSEIAERAEIAEGTIYNYFDSKGEILLSLFRRAFSRDRYRFPSLDADSADPGDEIVAFLAYYIEPARTMDKAILRELFSLIYRYTSEGAFVLTTIARFDGGLMNEVKTYLLGLQERGRVNGAVDLDQFVEIAYGVTMYALSKFIVTAELSYEDFLVDLTTKLRFMSRSMLTETG